VPIGLIRFLFKINPMCPLSRVFAYTLQSPRRTSAKARLSRRQLTKKRSYLFVSPIKEGYVWGRSKAKARFPEDVQVCPNAYQRLNPKGHLSSTSIERIKTALFTTMTKLCQLWVMRYGRLFSNVSSYFLISQKLNGFHRWAIESSNQPMASSIC